MWKRLYNFHLSFWNIGLGGGMGVKVYNESRNGADGLAPLSRQEMSTVWIV